MDIKRPPDSSVRIVDDAHDLLAGVVRLISAAVHDTNNLLMPLGGVIEGLRDSTEQGIPPAAEDLQALTVVTERLEQQTSALARISRLGTSSADPSEICAVLRGVVETLTAVGAFKRVVVHVEMHREVAWVRATKGSVERTLFSLLLQALAGVDPGTRDERSLHISLTEEPDGLVGFCTYEAERGVAQALRAQWSVTTPQASSLTAALHLDPKLIQK